MNPNVISTDGTFSRGNIIVVDYQNMIHFSLFIFEMWYNPGRGQWGLGGGVVHPRKMDNTKKSDVKIMKIRKNKKLLKKLKPKNAAVPMSKKTRHHCTNSR